MTKNPSNELRLNRRRLLRDSRKIAPICSPLESHVGLLDFGLPSATFIRDSIDSDMATDKFRHLDAVPAPLRICRKRLDSSCTTPGLNPLGLTEHQASRCQTLAKLPSQPLFDRSEGFDHEEFQMTKACKCPRSPNSPLSSPVPSPSVSSFGSSSRVSSLDFSALFMKSPSLRRDLEHCTCNQDHTFRQSFLGGTLEPGQSSRRSTCSIGSGYTSVYSVES